MSWPDAPARLATLKWLTWYSINFFRGRVHITVACFCDFFFCSTIVLPMCCYCDSLVLPMCCTTALGWHTHPIQVPSFYMIVYYLDGMNTPLKRNCNKISTDVPLDTKNLIKVGTDNFHFELHFCRPIIFYIIYKNKLWICRIVHNNVAGNNIYHTRWHIQLSLLTLSLSSPL